MGLPTLCWKLWLVGRQRLAEHRDWAAGVCAQCVLTEVRANIMGLSYKCE